MEIDKAFALCVKRKSTKNGYQIDCKLGLWGVAGANRAQVMNEARHYFSQYFEDGEYDVLINQSTEE